MDANAISYTLNGREGEEKVQRLQELLQLLDAAYDERTISKFQDADSVKISFEIRDGQHMSEQIKAAFAVALQHMP